MPANNVTLYVQWLINQYIVSFNGNGHDAGTVPSSIVQNFNTQVTIPTNSGGLSRTGYTFNGWNTQVGGGGTAYTGGNTFNMPARSTVLYAQWTEISVTPAPTSTPTPTPTPTPTSPSVPEPEEEEAIPEEEEDDIEEEISDEDAQIIRRIVEETRGSAVRINEETGVSVSDGTQKISTNERQKVHIYKNRDIDIEIPVESIARDRGDELEKVYTVLGESLVEMKLNTIGDKYVAKLNTGNVAGEQKIDILAMFRDGSTNSAVLDIFVDPYGYIYTLDSDGNQVRIKGAIVNLYKLEDGDRALYEKADQDNPQITNEAGEYAFFVEPGTYILTVTAQGYEDYESEEILVEKDIIEKNIMLEKKTNIATYLLYALIPLVAFPTAYILIKKKK